MDKTILVVDDDSGILDAIKLVLEVEGYNVLTTDAPQCLEWLDKYKPQMILLDVLLSGNDGRDIARKLKAEQSTRDIPLVMMSAHPSAKQSSKLAGADEFIPKPFELDELLQVVSKYTND